MIKIYNIIWRNINKNLYDKDNIHPDTIDSLTEVIDEFHDENSKKVSVKGLVF